MTRFRALHPRRLGEISGRLKNGARDIEDKINEKPRPTPHPWSPPAHRMDDLAELFNLSGFEMELLVQQAQREMFNNPLLRDLYGKFLMAAKLTCTEQVEAVKTRAASEHRKRETMNRNFRALEANWEKRRENLVQRWTETRETIRNRWEGEMRNLISDLEAHSDLENMDPLDRSVIDILVSREVAWLSPDQNHVGGISWDAVEAMSIQDIKDVMDRLRDMPGGEFLTAKD
jgi:hypothetical protein